MILRFYYLVRLRRIYPKWGPTVYGRDYEFTRRSPPIRRGIGGIVATVYQLPASCQID